MIAIGQEALAIREELGRITSSAAFRSSKRSKEFLDYIVSKALDGRLDELKERVIGSALFGRPGDYDTGTDSIVRVVASETRRRLHEFYQGEGAASPFRIDLVAGSYTPLMYRVESAAMADPGGMAVGVQPPEPPMALRPMADAGGIAVGVQPPQPPIAEPLLAQPLLGQPVRRWIPLTRVSLIWLAAVIGLAACCLFLALDNGNLRSRLRDNKQVAPTGMPWSALLDRGRGIHIVLADASVGGVQSFTRNHLSLSDYINGRYIRDGETMTEERASFLQFLLASQYTTASYAITAIRIAQLAESFHVPVNVSYAREMSLRTFKGGENFVILGTSRANPWAQLFEPQLNFVLEFGDLKEPYFRNRAPQAGETATYVPSPQPGPTLRESYGHVAFLPGLYQGGHILFVTGTNSQATEAAGEMITDGNRLNAELRRVGSRAGSAKQFEILLRVRHTAGAPVRSEIVAVR